MKLLWLHILLVSILPGCKDRNQVVGFADKPEKIIYYQLGETNVPIHVKQFSEEPELVFINLHDNEMTSVEAAEPLADHYGGLLIRIGNDRQRVIDFRFRGGRYSFDPNRMFSDTGIRESLKENSRYDQQAAEQISRFAERIISLIPEDAKYIIALHNNTNGGFSVESYLKGGEYQGDGKKVHQFRDKDPDDFILTTNEKIYNRSVRLGFNSILQDNKHATRDGSLSIWAGENDWKYINLETEHGKVTKYREMLAALLKEII